MCIFVATMARKNTLITSVGSEPTLRNQRMTFLLSKEEKALVERYLRKYRIGNRSRWMRETLLAFILEKLGQDYPTLFDEHDMRR